MARTTKFLYILTAVFAVVLCFVSSIAGSGTVTARAAVLSAAEYEQSNVLDDLKHSTINGAAFSADDYGFDKSKPTQVLSFAEYCYSYYANRQDNYGLYVYVYNPQGIDFSLASGQNKIQMSTGGNAGYSKYALQFLNASDNGLYLKYKIVLPTSERQRILEEINSDERVYRISGIELLINGEANATEYDVAKVYRYSGYAEGYGSNSQTSSTLTASSADSEVLSLDVHSTYYRSQGTNGASYTQDTLHSVYFSVPNEYIETYGEMTAVHATWLNALTNPILVTGNSTVYNAVLPYIGQIIDGGDFTYASDDNSPVPYAVIASKYIESASWNNASYGSSFMSYNANRHYTNSEKNLSPLYYCFLADNGDADNYTLPAEALIDYFGTYTNEHGGNSVVADKYSTDLFESYDSAFTEITISSNETFTLTDEVISQDLWQKFVGGGYHVTGTNAYTVSAIKRVKSTDFKSTQAATCEGLFIDESDYAEFKKYYDTATANKETVYLFRYYQSDYSCYEAVEYKRGKGDWTLLGTQFGYEYVDTNAYLMQMWVQLGFDIIDVTFTNENDSTIIPVVMSPLDLAADGKPPVITTPDGGLEWWQILFGIIALLFIVWLLIKFLPWIIYGLIKLVCLPFKAISKATKQRKEKKRLEFEEKAWDEYEACEHYDLDDLEFYDGEDWW